MIHFRKRHQLAKETGHLSGEFIFSGIKQEDNNKNQPTVANDITVLNANGKDSLWIDRGWRTTDTDKDSGLSETKLLSSGSNQNSQTNYTSDGGTDYAEVDTRNMSTFYNCRKVGNEKSLAKIELTKTFLRSQTPENPTPYATTMIIGSSADGFIKTSSSSTDQDSGTHSPHSEMHHGGYKPNYHQFSAGNYNPLPLSFTLNFKFLFLPQNKIK